MVWGDTPDTGPIASPDANEFDLTVDWRLNQGWSEKLWVRLRAAWVNQDDALSSIHFRIIVNYDFNRSALGFRLRHFERGALAKRAMPR